MMNGTKTKPGLLQEQPLSCYRVWTKPKPPKKPVRHGHTILGQYLLDVRNSFKS
jgi:hypothetical protein